MEDPTFSRQPVHQVEPIVAPPEPPENLIITGENLEDAHEARDLSDPYERVEQFLEDNAELFEATQKDWQKVRAYQRTILESNIRERDITAVSLSYQRPAKGGPRGDHRARRTISSDRHVRRKMEDKHATMAKQDIARTRYEAYTSYIEWVEQTTDKSDEAIAGLIGQFKGSVSNIPTTSNVSINYDRETTQNTALGQGYIAAYARQDVAIKVLEEGFSDETLRGPLLERITQLAEEERSSLAEFPGLLEILAAHQAREKGSSMIDDAIEMLPDETLRISFIEQFLDPVANPGKLKISKELGGIVAGIHLMAKISAQESGRPLENLGGLLLQYPDLWPTDMQTSYSVYRGQCIKDQQTSIYTLLEAYLERGRLPATPVERRSFDKVIDTQQLSAEEMARRASTRRNALSNSPGAKFTAPDAEDVRAAEEETRITQIALLKGQSGRNLYSVASLENGIDELMQHPRIADYVTRYQTEPDLKDTIRACLEHLTQQPYDRIATKRLVDADYSFLKEGSEYGHHRNMRRCSMQRIPNVNTGAVSSKTRIFYDIITMDGQPNLVFHSIRHKNEIEKSSKGF